MYVRTEASPRIIIIAIAIGAMSFVAAEANCTADFAVSPPTAPAPGMRIAEHGRPSVGVASVQLRLAEESGRSSRTKGFIRPRAAYLLGRPAASALAENSVQKSNLWWRSSKPVFALNLLHLLVRQSLLKKVHE